MATWLKFLICLLLLGITCGHQLRGSIVCYLRLGSDLHESLRSHLKKCSCIVVCDDVCDRRKPCPPSGGDTVALIRKLAPHAKILLSIPLGVNPFELRVEESSEQFCHEIENCVRDNLYDGIDLDFNAFVLDIADQIIFSHFLEKLKQRLRSKIIISLSLDVQRFTAGPLSNAIIKNVDFVVTSRDESFDKENQASEFVVRQYPESAIHRLLHGGFPPDKIILGLQTAGIVTNPLDPHDVPLKKCAIVGLIPYGQVCELRDQSTRYCSWHSDHRCLLFDGKSKVIYDNLDAVRERALQCAKYELKGVSILLNYDDSAGLCGEVKFPMLSTIDAILSKDFNNSHSKESKINNENARDQNKLNDEIHRLEMAVEKLEESTNLLQKIAQYLLRALYKLIDVVVSLVKMATIDETRKTEGDSNSTSLYLDEANENEDNHDISNVSLTSIVKEISELNEENNMKDIVSSGINRQEEVHVEETLNDKLMDNPVAPPVEGVIGAKISELQKTLLS